MKRRVTAPSERSRPSRASRRAFLLGAVALAGSGALAGWTWYNPFAATDGLHAIAVEEAHASAVAGRVLLVDIRRPDEWARTGIGAGAVPLDMRREDFETALLALAGGDATRPVALICARGVRSRQMSARLAAAGFTSVIDVPEGMLGSGAGPGWLARGLPTVTASPAEG